jgi:hypothetical protein
MTRKWSGLVIGVVVTSLSVVTMSGLALGVLVGQFTDTSALSCDRVPASRNRSRGTGTFATRAPRTRPTARRRPPRAALGPGRDPGIYRKPVPEELQVHVLEHGHVLLQYGPEVPEADIRKLERIGRKYSRDVVVAPYPALVAASA